MVAAINFYYINSASGHGVFAHTLIIIMLGRIARGLQSKLLITPLSE